MAIILCSARRTVFNPMRFHTRSLTTLQGNSHIFVFPNPQTPNSYILSLLPTEPPKPKLAIGVTSSLPPTASSFKENPAFLTTLQSVIADHAHNDPDVVSQGQVMAFTSGMNLAAVGRGKLKRRRDAAGLNEEPEGGADSPRRGGWIHISDTRNPPEFARSPWPEDIFGSLEIDGNGNIEGNYQPSGTYRLITSKGILGLSPFMQEKLIQRLRSEENS
ncbi:hypothetical protein I7I53_07718 [Histoplasma capsulatum var. duboisii H88]|uniref:Uncharacterized protein n=3 Tax=Ajellomyces capsulatus TaxID=5037 RepID=A0A8A1LCP4_AJEC8|nr:hypothetical protein I7I53_07718 [Histoplasma capsulatum var. duboisii H88]